MVKRLDCLKILLDKIDDKTITVTALTGVASEWDDLRGAHLNFCDLDMGLCTPVASGMACAQPKMRVISLDSDGSLLLDIGILVTLGKLKLKNLIIIVFDNEAYGRFGPTATEGTNLLENIGKASGIARARTVRTVEDFEVAISEALKEWELSIIVVKIEKYWIRQSEEHRARVGRFIKKDFVDSMKKVLASQNLANV